MIDLETEKALEVMRGVVGMLDGQLVGFMHAATERDRMLLERIVSIERDLENRTADIDNRLSSLERAVDRLIIRNAERPVKT